MKRLLTLALLSLCCTALPASAYGHKKSLIEKAEAAIADSHSFSVPAKGQLEAAFSPDEGSEHLVIKVIDSARQELLVLAYSFTSAPITEALVNAVHRGVKVYLVADYKDNVVEDKSGKARAALSALKTAGADVRIIRVYPIHHDKVIIADRNSIEFGSFNYSSAAAHKNSEHVFVNWNNPDLAAVYLQHFERNYKQAEVYSSQY